MLGEQRGAFGDQFGGGAAGIVLAVPAQRDDLVEEPVEFGGIGEVLYEGQPPVPTDQDVADIEYDGLDQP